MSASLRYLAHAAVGVLIGSALPSACSANDPSGGGGGTSGLGGLGGTDSSVGGGGATGATGGADSGTGGINLDGSLQDGKIDPDAACDLQKYQAQITKKPVDIIMIVDNSCSMSEEIGKIQQNIYSNFAQIISQSGLDYRVILIGEHGPASPDDSICIDPPLGGKPCSGVQANTPPSNNAPVFYHYDKNDVESWDSLCKILNWYKMADRYGLAPGGWSQWLRQDAVKTFVNFTDDQVDCKYPYPSGSEEGWYSSCSSTGAQCFNDSTSPQSVAQQFDSELLALDPAQFGTAQDRNYVWHSLTGVGKSSSATGAYAPTDPIAYTTCASGEDPGPGYQALSILTGGLRYPVCISTAADNYDVVFNKIAEGVIQGAKIECEFPMPEPPAGKELDLESIQLEYTPSAGGSPEKIQHVDDVTKCASGSFYYDWAVDGGSEAGTDAGVPNKIVLCPDTCKQVQSDNQAKIEILALCKSGGPI